MITTLLNERLKLKFGSLRTQLFKNKKTKQFTRDIDVNKVLNFCIFSLKIIKTVS